MKKYTLLSLLLLSTLLTTAQADKPIGWKPCEIIRDSMLTRLESKMKALKQAVRYEYDPDAHQLSLRLKYQQYLIESGKCVMEKRSEYYFEKWEVQEATFTGFTDWWLDLMQQKRKRKRKPLRVNLSGYDF